VFTVVQGIIRTMIHTFHDSSRRLFLGPPCSATPRWYLQRIFGPNRYVQETTTMNYYCTKNFCDRIAKISFIQHRDPSEGEQGGEVEERVDEWE